MKFSFSLIKNLVPGLKDKNQVIEALNLYAFEATDLSGDVIDISIPANRYSDAASHLGLARELSAILNVEPKFPKIKLPSFAEASAGRQKPVYPVQKSKFSNGVKKSGKFSISIQDKNLCPRYVGQYFENVKVGPSPKWMQDVLKSCGLRPINNIVDIANYVMLEIGEPMHAFDYDKLANLHKSTIANLHKYSTNNISEIRGKLVDIREIIIRRAEKGEKITTLDNEKYDLDNDILVIADSEGLLAIAGIKGGKKAEIDKNTKRIILEAANFDGANIHKTYKKIGLTTDAAVRFSHNISSALTMMAVNRASQLLKEIAGAKPGDLVDEIGKESNKKVIRFEIEKFNKLIGVQAKPMEIIGILKRLGFKIILDKLPNSLPAGRQDFLVEVPLIRVDIELFEDLAEEVARLFGYNNLKSIPPQVYLKPSGFEDQIVLKDKVRDVLVGLGLNEVYNYSFYKEGEIELENPIAEDKKYLRSSLIPLLEENISDNFRFFDEVKIFEIGKVFYRDPKSGMHPNIPNVLECLRLGMAIGNKIKKETFFELKGIIEELFERIGLIDYTFSEGKDLFEIHSSNEIVGYAKHEKGCAIAEINLDKILEFIKGEFEYQPLSKYPSIIRDVSILVSNAVKIGDIMQEMQLADPVLIKDVDLIDEYEGEHFEQNKKSLTLRIIFQAENRTLTDKEVNEKINKISQILTENFKAQIR